VEIAVVKWSVRVSYGGLVKDNRGDSGGQWRVEITLVGQFCLHYLGKMIGGVINGGQFHVKTRGHEWQ